MNHNLYLFSGLGADESVFARLKFPRAQLYHITWPNLTPHTSREDFLSQIKTQIKTRHNNIFLGVSFGGLVAQDIAVTVPVDTLIVVSSLMDAAEMPRIYKSLLARMLLKMTPDFLLNKPNFLLNHMFSIGTDESRQTLRDIIQDTEPAFVRWAVNYVQKWRKMPESTANRVFRIHGAKDRIFPCPAPMSGVAIVPGGHFAVYESADEINRLLENWLGQKK